MQKGGRRVEGTGTSGSTAAPNQRTDNLRHWRRDKATKYNVACSPVVPSPGGLTDQEPVGAVIWSNVLCCACGRRHCLYVHQLACVCVCVCVHLVVLNVLLLVALEAACALCRDVVVGYYC
jgi:hypothetical protein